jgi:acetolactate synthase-1/2/3 large subunit
MTIKYSDYLMQSLFDSGYSHCFYLAGGGSMHLLDSASRLFNCFSVVHEVSAVVAAEYYNATAKDSTKAFALLTTGPGLTNAITGIAGAWLESRNVLVVAGQVKTSDLKRGELRQQGIQEIDGVALVSSITKNSFRIDKPLSKDKFLEIVESGNMGRKGPVVVEVCLDVSSCLFDEIKELDRTSIPKIEIVSGDLQKSNSLEAIFEKVTTASRPLLLVGGGVQRDTLDPLLDTFERHKIPIAATWNGVDRISPSYTFWAGRPNTYGMRWANIFQQQSNLLIAVGTRLGLQQTGFNYQEFEPLGEIVHVDIDKHETEKLNPKRRIGINMDAQLFLNQLHEYLAQREYVSQRDNWVDFLKKVRSALPLIESVHQVDSGYASPYKLINNVSAVLPNNAIVVSCSSGGTFTAMHQAFLNKKGQVFLSNKGLASMGYGLAGAIGASFANPNATVFLFEGDGGFSQNLQELGTVAINQLNIKIFVFNNDGYASIRTSQKSYFQGNYLGCDSQTGLQLPSWQSICLAFNIPYVKIDNSQLTEDFQELLQSTGPLFIEVIIPKDFLYYPKVASKLNKEGRMVTSAIHDMSPPLSDQDSREMFPFFEELQ